MLDNKLKYVVKYSDQIHSLSFIIIIIIGK